VNAKKILIGVAVLVVLGGIVFANLYFKRETGVEVQVEKIEKRDLEAIVSASGKIQPKRSVNISANTMGRVTKLSVEEGDRVASGQFLLQIDPRSARSSVERGEAGLNAQRTAVEQARMQLESAKTQLTLAQDTLKRQQDLWKDQLTTKENLDRAENDVKVRQREVQVREAEISVQGQRIRQSVADLDNAKYNLSQVTIESPIEGIVTRRNIEEGEKVVIGTMNNAGTVLLTIADMSIIEAELEVDETDVPNLRTGQKAKVTIDALPDKTFPGTITEIGNSPIQSVGAAASGGATNFKVVVTIEGEVPDVRPGFTCTADITTATREKAVAVPIQAATVRELVFDDKGNVVRPPAEEQKAKRRPGVQAAELKPGQTKKEAEGVFTAKDGKAVFVPLKTGIAGEKYFEVLSGLQEGDQVITGPFNSVRDMKDGDPVKVQDKDKAQEKK
jgi:HlyD family secretion protein